MVMGAMVREVVDNWRDSEAIRSGADIRRELDRADGRERRASACIWAIPLIYILRRGRERYKKRRGEGVFGGGKQG